MKYEKINNFEPPNTRRKNTYPDFYVGQRIISNTNLYDGDMAAGEPIIIHHIAIHESGPLLFCYSPSGHYKEWGGLLFWPNQVRVE